MASMMGNKMKVSIFGQSHGEKIGVVVDGLPAGEKIDMDALNAFMQRRAPGQALTTARKEGDVPHIVSGVVDFVTCGAPLCIVIDNADTHSKDYSQFKRLPRPGHADYPAWVKDMGFNDVRGGGHFSARLTAPLCAAGGILMQLYARRGVHMGAHLYSVMAVKDIPFDMLKVDNAIFDSLSTRPFPTLCEKAGERMLQEIAAAKAQGDSVGGVVECAVTGLPVGLGAPMFDGLENVLAKALFAIPAVKGVEFGEGFAVAQMRGSENNDPYAMQEGKVALTKNSAGGILGGLSTGAPLILRAAFKPTPSIALAQRTVDLKTMTDAELIIHGRHDPCVAVRAVPCVMAAAAVALADFIL